MKTTVLTTLLALTVGIPALAFAGDSTSSTFSSETSAEVSRIWDQGNVDFYLPLHTHHLRSAYSPKLIASFNENPWGLGVGKSYKDADGGWHGLYAMEFLDSHSRVEPIAGYGRLYRMGQYRGVSTNLGYTAFVTAREDIAHYAPVPGILPLLSTEYGRASLMTTFMPGRHNNGNLFFIFGKYSFSR